MSARRRVVTNRGLFVLVSLITVILLLGSAILQRIVFTAEQSSASVYFEQAAYSAPLNETVELPILARLEDETIVAGAELSITYDGQVAENIEFSAGKNWEVVAGKQTANTLRYSLLPSKRNGTVVRFQEPVLLGSLNLSSKLAAQTTFSIDPLKSVILGIDLDSARTYYNALTSAQSTSVSFSSTASPNTSHVVDEFVEDASQASAVLSQQIALGTNTAVIIANYAQDFSTVIEFGTDRRNLTGSLRFGSSSRELSAVLSGLNPGTRYYYRLRLTDADNSTTQTQVRSFTTPVLGSGEVDLNSSLQIFSPSAPKQTAQLYAQVQNAQGEALSGELTASVEAGQAQINQINQVAPGLYRISLRALLPNAETISVLTRLNTAQITVTKLTLDPSQVSTDNNAPETPEIAWNRQSQFTLIGLLLVMLLSALAFIKLSRVR